MLEGGDGQTVQCVRGHKFEVIYDEDDAEKRWLIVLTDLAPCKKGQRFAVDPADALFS